jgi:hypothetical protein
MPATVVMFVKVAREQSTALGELEEKMVAKTNPPALQRRS